MFDEELEGKTGSQTAIEALKPVKSEERSKRESKKRDQTRAGPILGDEGRPSAADGHGLCTA